MSRKIYKILIPIIIGVVMVTASALASWHIFKYRILKINYDELKLCSKDYKFINSEVACLISSEKDFIEKYQRLETKIKEFTDYSLKNEKATDISVFVRDLVSRRWVGINENENYAPASLLKLPLIVAYYKLSEIQPEILSKKYVYNGPGQFNNEMQDIKPENNLEPGKEYSIEELLYRMIVYSENNAVEPLAEIIGTDFINKVFVDLGIYVPATGGLETNFLSTKMYGAVLRTLFNSSYLNPSNSEKVLEILNQSTFDKGLVAGVPEDIKIAHKFGEREIKNENGKLISRNLYDCGIIYWPENPYLLCVMTRGSNFDDLKEIIKNISQITYKEFSD